MLIFQSGQPKCGKMPEPHFDAQLSPNPGENVPKCEKTSWTQDLRVKQMHSSAPKYLFSQMSRRNADNKRICKTSQLQCLTSIYGHKLTKSSGIWELQLLTKKCHLKHTYFPTKFHFSQMSRRNADNKLMWEIAQLQCLTLIHAHKMRKFSAIWEL